MQIDTSLSAVLSDLLNTTVSLPSESGGVSSTGTVPAAVAGILQQAQTDYTNALAALKAGNLAAVPDRRQPDAAGDRPGAGRDRGDDPGGDDDHHHDHDGATGQGGEDVEEGGTTTTTHASTTTSHDDDVGAGEHRAQEHHESTTTSTTLVSAAPKT